MQTSSRSHRHGTGSLRTNGSALAGARAQCSQVSTVRRWWEPRMELCCRWITQVALNDTSYFTFDYTNSLQVSVIRKYFGATERKATSFTYEPPGSDVPRLISSSVSAQNWTGLNGVP